MSVTVYVLNAAGTERAIKVDRGTAIEVSEGHLLVRATGSTVALFAPNKWLRAELGEAPAGADA